MVKVKKGDIVKVDYIGKHDDGGVFDTSIEDKAKEYGIHHPERDYNPLEVEIGKGQLIKGFEDGLVGMGSGEEKEVKISPADGYGERSTDLLRKVPLGAFVNQGLKAKVGMKLQTAQGIVEVTNILEDAGMAEVDFNHPLSGKDLVFWMKVIGINEQSESSDSASPASGKKG